MIHLPFILFPFKNQLKTIWLAVESMLQIVQILLSDEINDEDLKRLSNVITVHLECYQNVFGQTLKPKHHFLLHYVRVIQLMGPVVKFWALRMESKHQFFKREIQNTKNFVNIKKSLAYKHQEHFFAAPASLTDDIKFGKLTLFIECDSFGIFVADLKMMAFTDDAIQASYTAKSLNVNDRYYKPGVLVASDSKFYEIERILSIRNDTLFLCNKCYDISSHDSFLNSFKIKSKGERAVLNIRHLKNNKAYEKKHLDGSIYVIEDCLVTYKMNIK